MEPRSSGTAGSCRPRGGGGSLSREPAKPSGPRLPGAQARPIRPGTAGWRGMRGPLPRRLLESEGHGHWRGAGGAQTYLAAISIR